MSLSDTPREAGPLPTGDEIIYVNGVEVEFRPRAARTTADVEFFVRAGMADEQGLNSEALYKPGTAHFTEHIVFDNDAIYAPNGIGRKILMCGGDIDAGTYRNQTVFNAFDLPPDLACETAAAFSGMLSNPDFARKFEQERSAILCELWLRSDLDPEGKTKIQGTQGAIAAMTPQDIKQFCDARYTARNMRIVVTGAFDRDELLKILQQKLVFDLSGSRPAVSGESFRAATFECKRAAQVIVNFNGNPKVSPADYAVAREMLIGAPYSPLREALRLRRGLVYSIDGEFDKKTNSPLFKFVTASEDVEKCLNVMANEMSRMSVSPLDARVEEAQLLILLRQSALERRFPQKIPDARSADRFFCLVSMDPDRAINPHIAKIDKLKSAFMQNPEDFAAVHREEAEKAMKDYLQASVSFAKKCQSVTPAKALAALSTMLSDRTTSVKLGNAPSQKPDFSESPNRPLKRNRNTSSAQLSS